MPGRGYTAEKIQSMFGNSEIDLRFTTPIPVHITYQTAFVDDSGQLQIRDDLYGRDARLLAALKDGDRRVAGDPGRAGAAEPSRPPVRLPTGRRRQRLEQRPIVLRPALWQPDPAGAAAAGRSAPGEPRDHPLSAENGVSAPGRPLSTCC